MAKRLFVGNLSYSTTEETLKKHFEQCGTVESAEPISDRMTGRPKGFGFVEMATEEEAQKAIETLNGSTLDGREIAVNEARPREERTPSTSSAPVAPATKAEESTDEEPAAKDESVEEAPAEETPAEETE